MGISLADFQFPIYLWKRGVRRVFLFLGAGGEFGMRERIVYLVLEGEIEWSYWFCLIRLHSQGPDLVILSVLPDDILLIRLVICHWGRAVVWIVSPFCFSLSLTHTHTNIATFIHTSGIALMRRRSRGGNCMTSVFNLCSAASPETGFDIIEGLSFADTQFATP